MRQPEVYATDQLGSKLESESKSLRVVGRRPFVRPVLHQAIISVKWEMSIRHAHLAVYCMCK